MRQARGAVTPLAVAGIVLCAIVALLAAAVGGVLVARRQAQSAADLAALAGATAVQHGRDGCAAAVLSAGLNTATLTGCLVEGQVVTVRVSRATPRMWGRELTVQAEGRAGPR